MIRATGLRRDDGRHPRKQFQALAKALRATPRGWADLTMHAPPVLDQGPVGSCTACGTLASAYTSMSAEGAPLPWLPSVDLIYKVSRCLDRAADYPLRQPDAYPALTDRGSQVLSAVQALREWGVLPSRVPGRCDCTMASCNEEPDIRTLAVAGRKLLVGAYELEVANLELQTQLALDAGVAVAVGGWVDTAYMDADGSVPVGPCDIYDRNGGGHCQAVIGYTTDSGQALYLVQNSWGSGWADHGRIWVTGAWLRQIWEAYALQVRTA